MPNQGEFLWVKRMGNAVTTEIKVLSAGAVEPGIVKVIDSYQRETAHNVKVTFATAPTILKRIGEANIADLVIAPPPCSTSGSRPERQPPPIVSLWGESELE